ncbi:MAG: transglycosylase domain-containing protein [Spirochaetaceae bacterium]|jgi:penicillin-binding protein 1C|nr:transglycosylase domain-containing protein [Spirochaetaceae bacterium]
MGKQNPRLSGLCRLRRVKRIVAVLVCAVLVAALFGLTLRLLPYPELAAYRNRSFGLALSDRNGAVLRVFPAADGVKREWAPLDAVPPQVARLFIRAEDRRFFLHAGIDPLAVAARAVKNLREKRVVSGASTITMQLARLIRPRTPGIGGKVREVWDALRLEARLSKRDILELWLNGIPFGSNIEGLPAMARARFAREVGRLDERHGVLLAVIPRRPGAYDLSLNPERAVRAAMELAERAGLRLTEGSLRAAAAEARAPDQGKNPFYAPHFTERVRAALKDAPGRSVRTTLDAELQAYAEQQLAAELSGLRNNRVTNGAVLAVENQTGAVRVYVGSASWFDDRTSGKIDGVQARNQPGSCLKPFLYAKALDHGFGPGSVLPDIPTIFGAGEAYIPGNFNRRFNGPVRFRVALASSLNIPAVYLLERVGVRAFEEYLVSLGFDSIADRRGTHGVGLALGNGEVSLEELVRGFAAFPRGGTALRVRWLQEEEEEGAETSAGAAVMSPYAAWVIADILSDRSSRFVGFGPAPALAASSGALFKTGTANQYQHIWALGATRRHTVGVWMGNFSGETVVGKTGSSVPARLAASLLNALEREAGGAAPNTGHPGGAAPENAARVGLCALSGMAAGPDCTGAYPEWIRQGLEPPPCDWHRGGPPVYPPEYQAWLSERFRAGGISRGRGIIRIPVSRSVFYLDPSLPEGSQAIRIETAGFGHEALVYDNHALMGSLSRSGVFILPLAAGFHRVVVEDESGETASVEFEAR